MEVKISSIICKPFRCADGVVRLKDQYTSLLGNLFLSFPPELRAPKFDFGTARDHQYTGLDMASAQGGEAADGEIQRAKKLTTDLQVKQSNDFFCPTE